MASFSRAIGEGLRGGRASLVAAAYLYAAALAASLASSAPLASWLHGALDAQPGADRLIVDGGIAVVEELGRVSPGGISASLALVLPLMIVFLPLGVLLMGGAYGLAAGPPDRPWRRFWVLGAERFPAFFVRGAVGAVYAAGGAAVAVAVVAAIAAASREPSGRLAYWLSMGGRAAVVAFAALHARTVLGFAFALREAFPRERSLPGFNRSLALCWRRLVPTHALGALFLALQAVSALAGLTIARLAGEGGWLAAAAAQAGWFGVAWLRAAEVRARIVYASPEAPGLPPGPEAGIVRPEGPPGREDGAACSP